jgi:hypothetical protein
MATRMQQRRGTSAQWTSANPVLASGEIGFETDTNKLKIGDGVNTWANLSYFIDETNLSASLGDYVELSSVGVADGVASLDENGFVPASQLDINLTGYATETFVNTAVSNLVDSAPGVLDTLNELAAAIGDDANFATTVTNAIAAKQDDVITTEGDLIVGGEFGPERLGIGVDGQVLTAGASTISWETPSADIPLSTITTAGDLIVGTGAGAVSRLGIGAGGQVLLSSGAVAYWSDRAAPKLIWQLFATGNLPTGSDQTTISGLTGYDNYIILFSDVRIASPGADTYIGFNSDTTGNFYTFSTRGDGNDNNIGSVLKETQLKLFDVGGDLTNSYCSLTVSGASAYEVASYYAITGSESVEERGDKAFVSQGTITKGYAPLTSLTIYSPSVITAGTYEIFGA